MTVDEWLALDSFNNAKKIDSVNEKMPNINLPKSKVKMKKPGQK